MANMSYCRFQNTLEDLRDCRDALNENGLKDLSADEREAAELLIQICDDIAADWADQ